MAKVDSESQLVDRIRAAAARAQGAPVTLGIGDDCAIFRPRAGEELVFTTDMLIEDVHFRRRSHPAPVVGRKALARGLSDIAAMGAAPRFCLLSLALAPWTTTRWIEGFYRGLLELAKESGTTLAGGDLSHAPALVCDIVVCGAVPRDKALRRDGAKPGDAIYCSGLLGGSARGLSSPRGPARQRHLLPEPRLALGEFLRQRLHATACMDLSDGISRDLPRLCAASGVSAAIVAPPRFPGATAEQALHGGEDYELLFTVSPKTRVPADFAGLPLTRIGEILAGRPGEVRLNGRRLPKLGYDHMAARKG
jgi:thiamine-monophosphate kinase